MAYHFSGLNISPSPLTRTVNLQEMGNLSDYFAFKTDLQRWDNYSDIIFEWILPLIFRLKSEPQHVLCLT
jgi:hypothetical protein